MVDYIAEVLKHLRTEDFTSAYKKHFEIVSEVSTRDQTGFEKTFSGLMKILFPDGKATSDECAELLSFAIEGRRRVREHILRIDDTFRASRLRLRILGHRCSNNRPYTGRSAIPNVCRQEEESDPG